MTKNTKPYISEFVQKHLPHASLAEQLEAQAAVDRYLLVIHEVYLRLKREGKWPLPKRDADAR